MICTPLVVLLAALAAPTAESAADWRTDPAWYGAAAEWAVYDAVRPIYGVPRRYEATLFTNKQAHDLTTTTKADQAEADTVEVFKHNLSEMVPTQNYTYRFLTTCFVRTDTLSPIKVVASTQEDCGATYHQFVSDGRTLRFDHFCYFPGAGVQQGESPAPAELQFHDALSLTLRDYDFGAAEHPPISWPLIGDQTDTHETPTSPAEATVTYVDRETLTLPCGEVDAHHLRVEHPRDGGSTTTDYWFAADPEYRHVMVKYEGPYGVQYELKKLGWWTYWDSGAEPEVELGR